MDKTLDVYFNEKVVGQLVQDKHGDMNFTYAASWLDSPHAVKISCSLPLQKETFKQKACHAFFGGILPEEIQRKIIAKNLGISANNDFSMLEKIGGECAGALSFMPVGGKPTQQAGHYQELTEESLANILRELPVKPLLAGEEGIRLSLAGVQDKIAVYVKDGKIAIPLDNSPSTHILKPDFTTYEGVIFNEAFCLKLAKQISLPTANVEIKKVAEIDYLLVERYDRKINEKPSGIIRIHQEDFCQALSIPSSNKYQNEGGPSFKQCFDLIRAESSTPILDLNKMINAVIFNFLIGNCDAHGKNFSLLFLHEVQLAPLYDLISTVYYKELSLKMAMKLGGEYKINLISTQHFDKLAEEIGFSKPEIHKRINELIDTILSSLPLIPICHPVQEAVAKLIQARCENFASVR